MIQTACNVLADAYQKNWITSRDGNISLRVAEQDFFFITPSGVRKQELVPEQFKKIKIKVGMRSGVGPGCWEYESQIMDNGPLSAGLMPSGEWRMHFLLMQQIPHDRVVIHLHPTYCISAMFKGLALDGLTKDFPELSRYTRVAKDIGIVDPLTMDLALAVKEHLGVDVDGKTKYDIVGLKNHGVVSVGRDVQEAYEHIERLEHICKIVILSSK